MKKPETPTSPCWAVILTLLLALPLACGDGDGNQGADAGDIADGSRGDGGGNADGATGCAQTITFVQDFELFQISPDGTGFSLLATSETAELERPIYNPSGTRIAYFSVELGAGAQVTVMNADGSQSNLLTNAFAENVGYMRWLSDDRLVFIADTNGDFITADLVAIDFDGSDRQTLIPDSPAFAGIAASPSLGTIFYLSSNPGGIPPLYAVDFDGTNDRLVTMAITSSVDVNPAGTKLAFNRGVDSDIFTMNPDGTAEVNLTVDLAGQNTFPLWTPNGSAIVFQQRPGAGAYDLHSMNADGSGKSQLTTTPSSEGGVSFSPDGTQIVFRGGLTPDSQLVVANIDGSNPQPLPGTDGSFSPQWKPCGSSPLLLSRNP